ncbi:Undecaprenyl-phosphate glucose phosphotransferase [Lachnospiraceae bacterium PF1-21]|uniref:undecaprenyl-phosphate glucose phosphotransferase n=1 Tax=Ohessyouella blattaphilus TaxID=2949333 RepID=UPI003E1C5525
MIKDNEKLINRLRLLIDVVAIIFSYIASWYIKFRSGIFTDDLWYYSLREYCVALIYIVPGYILLYYVFQLYASKRLAGRREEAWHIIQANVIGLMAFILILYLLKENNYSRMMIFVFFCTNVYTTVITRNIIRQGVRNLRKHGYNQKQILLIGYSEAAKEYVDRINLNPEWGYQVRGILDDHVESGTTYGGVKVLGTIANLDVVLPMTYIDEIAITLSIDEYSKLAKIVAMCEKSGVHTKFIPDYNQIIPTKPYTEDLNGLPVINIRKIPLSIDLNSFLKRAEDIFGAIVAIILFSPIMLVTALAVKTTSKGPLIFKQERMGLNNKTFNMYKFRSMAVQDQKEEKDKWTVPNDPRVTPVGRIIRKTSIDELPQLFNVLLGKMSLVGPRPERPQFVEKFKEEIPRYMIKHQVRPGITGWAQVNGLRGDTSIYKRVEYDLYYIENWTLGFDFKILFLTFFKGFINKNAY